MRTTHCFAALFTICALAFVGCRKSGHAQTESPEYFGVKVDWPKLDEVFINASPDVEASVSLVKRAFRYGQYPQAVAPLDALSRNPNLTEGQKKLINDLVEQTRQVIAKMPSRPAQ